MTLYRKTIKIIVPEGIFGWIGIPFEDGREIEISDFSFKHGNDIQLILNSEEQKWIENKFHDLENLNFYFDMVKRYALNIEKGIAKKYQIYVCKDSKAFHVSGIADHCKCEDLDSQDGYFKMGYIE